MDVCKSCGRILIDLQEKFDPVDHLLLNKLLLLGLSSLTLFGISPPMIDIQRKRLFPLIGVILSKTK